MEARDWNISIPLLLHLKLCVSSIDENNLEEKREEIYRYVSFFFLCCCMIE
jgi:hypothetical protein